jgi:hypothetical protein
MPESFGFQFGRCSRAIVLLLAHCTAALWMSFCLLLVKELSWYISSDSIVFVDLSAIVVFILKSFFGLHHFVVIT